MSTQMTHVLMPGPGGLQSSVCIVSARKGNCWYIRLQPGFVIRHQLPGTLRLQVFSSLPCSSSNLLGGSEAGGHILDIPKVREQSLLQGHGLAGAMHQ